MVHLTRSPHWPRWGVVLGVLVAVLALATPASAHGGDESSEADVLVRQAIALIVNTPNDTMTIEDKIADALRDKDSTTVDLKLVAKAKAELAKGDIHRTRAYLEASIGARPHTDVGHLHPIRITDSPLAKREVQAALDRATGAESGTNVAIEGLPADRTHDSGTWLGLVAMIAIVIIGATLSIRYRPPVAVRDVKAADRDEEQGR